MNGIARSRLRCVIHHRLADKCRPLHVNYTDYDEGNVLRRGKGWDYGNEKVFGKVRFTLMSRLGLESELFDLHGVARGYG